MGKIAVIAGGGSHGSEVVGMLCTKKKNYDVYIGTSTGALIALLAACGKYEELAEEYTTTTNRDMFGAFRPFRNNGKMSKVRMSAAIVRMISRNKLYLFDLSERLEAKVRKNFTKGDFKKLQRLEKRVVVTNFDIDLTGISTVYVSNLDEGMYYDKFVKHVVASAAIPFFSKPIDINGWRYLDGGVLDPIPTAYIEKYKNHEVDVWLMHSKRDVEQKREVVSGWMDLLVMLLNSMRGEIKRDDLEGLEWCNVIYSSYKDFSSANFDRDKMGYYFEVGVERVKDGEV